MGFVIKEDGQGTTIGSGVRKKKSFSEVLKGVSSSNVLEEKETCKSIFFNSTKEDKMKFAKAKVGVARLPGLAFGVAKSLIEE